MSHLVSWRDAFIHRLINPFLYQVTTSVIANITSKEFSHCISCKNGFLLFGKNSGIKVRTDGTILEFSCLRLFDRNEKFFILQTNETIYDLDAETEVDCLPPDKRFQQKIPSYLSTKDLFYVWDWDGISVVDSFGEVVPGPRPSYLYKDKPILSDDYYNFFAGSWVFSKKAGGLYAVSLETTEVRYLMEISPWKLEGVIFFQGSYYFLFRSDDCSWKVYLVG